MRDMVFGYDVPAVISMELPCLSFRHDLCASHGVLNDDGDGIVIWCENAKPEERSEACDGGGTRFCLCKVESGISTVLFESESADAVMTEYNKLPKAVGAVLDYSV